MSYAREECYYGNDVCSGELWQCLSCGEYFCTEGHWHRTSLGENVECVACERERLEHEKAN